MPSATPPLRQSLPAFKRALVVVKTSTDPDGLFTERVRSQLSQAGIAVNVVAAHFEDGCQALYAQRNQPLPCFMVVIGGDGTFLRAAQCFAPAQIPMVGINRGNLGFLTRIETTQLEGYLQRIITGDFKLEERLLLQVVHEEGNTPTALAQRVALNDLVVKTANPSQMARLQLAVDGVVVACYDADGLIISTPTGSTAYNLAAGGPVVVPTVQALCITPICPHSLAAKPIVVPSSAQLCVEAVQKNLHPLLYTLDGQDPHDLPAGQRLWVGQAPHTLLLMHFDQEEDNFYWLLRQKLAWAANPRQA
jgi:NAD+ kinase